MRSGRDWKCWESGGNPAPFESALGTAARSRMETNVLNRSS
jgi:hypothetical protein